MNRKRRPRRLRFVYFLIGFVLLTSQFSFAEDSGETTRRAEWEESPPPGGSDPKFLKLQLLSRSFTLRTRVELPQVMHEKKSVLKAVVLSLLVPGMGELYADRFDVGRYMVISESGLWMTYTGFRLYGGLLRDDARDFAKVHGQIDPTGKQEQYYVDIGNFRDVFEYNEKQLRDREVQNLYDPDGGFFWRWEDEGFRLRYRELRVSSDAVFNNSRFVIGAIIVNHVLSALNAARLTAAHNRTTTTGQTFQIRANVLGSLGYVDGVVLTVSKSF